MGENSGTTSTLTILESSALSRDAGHGVVLCSGKVVSRHAADLRTGLFSGDSLLSAKVSMFIVVSSTQVYNGINEELVWFENFKSNIEIIWATNAGNLTYTLGINEFADLTQGVVSLVKNQRQCGSCWGFSTTGALEGAWALSTGSPASLNERQFVDCDSTCSG